MLLKMFNEQALRSFDRDAHRTSQRGDQFDKNADTVDGVSDLAAYQLLAVMIEDTDVMEASTPVDPAPITVPHVTRTILIHRSKSLRHEGSRCNREACPEPHLGTHR